MFGFRPSPPGGRSRMRATRALFIRHGAEGTPEGRSLRLLRQWLSPAQREQFARKGYFEVVGSDSGKRYRIQTCEGEVRAVARRFTPNGFHFRQTRPLG